MLKNLTVVKILIKHLNIQRLAYDSYNICYRSSRNFFPGQDKIKKLGTVMGESHIDFRTQCVIMTQTT